MEIASIVSSLVSLLLGIYAIWLSITFFRMSNESSNRVHESSKGIDASVTRLEKLFDHLYADTFSMMKDTVSDMRKHVWTNNSSIEEGAIEEVERRADNKVQQIRDELNQELSRLAVRMGGTDARVEQLSEQLMPMMDQALSRSRNAETEAREEALRDSLLRRYDEVASTKSQVTGEDLVMYAAGTFGVGEVFDEMDKLQKEGLLTWDGTRTTLGPNTVISRPTSSQRKGKA